MRTDFFTIRIRRNGLWDIAIFLMIISLLAFEDITLVCLGTQAIAFFLSFLQFVNMRSRLRKEVALFAVWAILFSVFCFLSVFWASAENNNVSRNAFSTVQGGLIAISILLYCDSTERIRFVTKAFIYSAILFCIRFLLTVPLSQWGNQQRFSNDSIFGSNANATALCYAALLIVLSIHAGSEKKRRIFLYAAAGLCVLVSVLMGTRAGIIGFMAGFILLLLFRSNTPLKLLGNLLAIVIAGIIACWLIMNVDVLYNSVGYRMETLLSGLMGMDTDKSTGTRMAFIVDAFEVFLKHPIVGVGLDGYRFVNSVQPMSYSHCTFTELLANLGIIGFLLFYCMHFRLLPQLFKYDKLKVTGIPILGMILVLDMTTVSYSNETTFILLAILVAMLHVNKRVIEKGV